MFSRKSTKEPSSVYESAIGKDSLKSLTNGQSYRYISKRDHTISLSHPDGKSLYTITPYLTLSANEEYPSGVQVQPFSDITLSSRDGSKDVNEESSIPENIEKQFKENISWVNDGNEKLHQAFDKAASVGNLEACLGYYGMDLKRQAEAAVASDAPNWRGWALQALDTSRSTNEPIAELSTGVTENSNVFGGTGSIIQKPKVAKLRKYRPKDSELGLPY